MEIGFKFMVPLMNVLQILSICYGCIEIFGKIYGFYMDVTKKKIMDSGLFGGVISTFALVAITYSVLNTSPTLVPTTPTLVTTTSSPQPGALPGLPPRHVQSGEHAGREVCGQVSSNTAVSPAFTGRLGSV